MPPYKRDLIFTPMATSATLSSSSFYSPFDPTHLRDDSFSTYLALMRQSFTTDLAHRKPQPVNNPPSSRRSTSLSFRRTDEGELDVFTAERYFSNTLHLKDFTTPENSVHKHSSSSSKKQQSVGVSRSRSSAGSASSSCVNSQSNLLRDRRQRSSGGARKSFLGIFSCPCSKDDSVEVEERETTEVRQRSGAAVDIMSDSSSELFEIESLQQQVVYEPSEASIEWSVVTASAANMSVAGLKEGLVKKRRASGLLTLGYCASEKAVSTVSAERVVALERYHAMMMELESASVVGEAAAR